MSGFYYAVEKVLQNLILVVVSNITMIATISSDPLMHDINLNDINLKQYLTMQVMSLPKCIRHRYHVPSQHVSELLHDIRSTWLLHVFSMGLHPRLGAEFPFVGLHEDIFKKIVQHVHFPHCIQPPEDCLAEEEESNCYDGWYNDLVCYHDEPGSPVTQTERVLDVFTMSPYRLFI
jgi:hypothetical protein